MFLYSILCLCFLIASPEGVLSSTRDELLSRIGNRHMLTTRDVHSLKNVPQTNVFEEYIARDCMAAYRRGRRQNGLYIIHPKDSPLLAVYCDMKYAGGGWTVLQKNDLHQKTTWSGKWDDYKNGFGHLSESHWLGNEFIHLLTRQNAFLVRFVMTDRNGEEKYAEYESFKVDDEHGGYALRLGNYSGNAGDVLTTMGEPGIHDNMWFSTSDRDNDRRASTNCALEHGGGWWYDNCYSALLNGDGPIYWRGLCSENKICTSAAIMIKPSGKNCHIP